MRVVRHSALNLGGRIASYFLLATNGLILARLLGPQGRGEYALLILSANFAVMSLTFGLGTSNVFFVSQKQGTKEEMVSLSVLVGLITGVLAISAFWIFDRELIGLFMRGVDPSHLRLISFVIPANLMFNYALGILQGQERFVLFNAINVFRPLLFLAIFLLLYIAGMDGVPAGIWAYIVGFILGSVILYWRMNVLRVDLSVLRPAFVRKVFRYGWDVYLAEIFRYLFHRIDLFLIGLYLNTTQAGYYSIIALFAESSWFLAASVGNAMLPAAGYESPETMRRIVPVALRIVLSMTGIGLLAFLLIDRIVITFAFGQDFLPALLPLRLTYLGIWAMSGIKVIASYILSIDRARLNSRVNMLGLSLNILLNLILIPVYGIAGAALTTSACFVMMFLFFVVWLQKHLNISLRSMLIIRIRDLSQIRDRLRDADE